MPEPGPDAAFYAAVRGEAAVLAEQEAATTDAESQQAALAHHAAAAGVSLREARRRFAALDEARVLQQRLAASFPEQFGGLYLDREDGAIVVQWAGDPAVLRRVLPGERYRVETVSFSQEQLVSAFAEASAELRAEGVAASLAVDVRTNSVEVEVLRGTEGPARDALSTAVDEAPGLRGASERARSSVFRTEAVDELPGPARGAVPVSGAAAVPAPRTVLPAAAGSRLLYAGERAWNPNRYVGDCTWGFSVRHTSGDHGLVTAGHCGDDDWGNEHELWFTDVPMDMVVERYIAARDVQVHRVRAGNDAVIVPQVLDFSTDVQSPRFEPIYRTRSRAAIVVGEDVRKSGITTNVTDGVITSVVASPAYMQDVTATYIAVRPGEGEERFSDKGDSGSAVYWNGTAFGIVSGGWDDGHESYVMSVDYLPYGWSIALAAPPATPGVPPTPTPTPTPSPTPSIPANGIVRTPEGTIWVLAGGAKYAMSWPEYVAIGTPRYTSLPASSIAAYGTVPRTNTFLRNPANGSIYQVVDGAKYRLSSMAEWQSLGSPGYVNVPQGFIDRVSGTVPQGPIFLRNPVNGSIYQVVGGAKYKLPSLGDWHALGSPAYVNVPQGFIDRVTAPVPQGTWFLRDRTQTIHQVVGGAKFALSYPEWSALGFPAYVEVPSGFTAVITATVPAGRVYLRDGSGNIYRVEGGAKTYLSYAAWVNARRPAYVQVPTRWLQAIPNA